MSDFLKKDLKSKLEPLYGEMLANNSFKGICTFCIQWGVNFPSERNQGIIFIGKAVNGWITDEIDVKLLFGETSERIFARHDQMKWVSNLEGDKNYNTNKSAFWRVNKKISQALYPKEEWYSKVAWSNLCKIAPFKGGNPNDPMYYEQLYFAKKILETELEALSPKFVILFTSNWEIDFLHHLNDNQHPEIVDEIYWKGYKTKLIKIKDIFFIASQHPQGKNESIHVNAILELIKKYD